MSPNQKLLNRLVPRLRRQGVKSYNPVNEFCFYRDGKGNKCLIGHGIKNEFYSPSYETKSISDDNVKYGLIRSNSDIKDLERCFHKDFWQDVQSAHDFAGPSLEGFEERLEKVCNEYGYSVPPK